MNIKSKVYVLNTNESKIKALASITIENSFVVTGLKIVESNRGDLFLSMPNRKLANGEYKDTAFPITAECRQQIIDVVMAEYKKAIGGAENNTQESPLFDNGNWQFDDSLPF